MQFISIIDTNKRKSTLGIDKDDRLVVIGVLSHGSMIRPESVADCDELARWAERQKLKLKLANLGFAL